MKYITGTIELKGMKFYARHGVMKQETEVGAWFTVDLCLQVGIEKAALSDDLNDTLNYADVYQCLKETMNQPSKLVETAAGRIAEALFERFHQIKALTIRVIKDNPPVGGCECAGFGVELSYER